MRISVVITAWSVGFLLSAAGNAQTSRKTGVPPQSRETLWQWALRFSGVSANPSTLKGADDEPFAGQVWTADLQSGATRKITTDDGYRSPVFYPNGADILALQGADVVRISSGGGEPAKLYHIPGITKLVGFGLDDPDHVLILNEDPQGHSAVSRLSLKTGALAPLPYDPQSSRDREMLEGLQGWQRTYGAATLYVKRESRQTLSGTVERSNVLVKSANQDPLNISKCDTTDCGQPSLSPDGVRVLFIKGGL